jgi:DNA-binding protein HU-beta
MRQKTAIGRVFRRSGLELLVETVCLGEGLVSRKQLARVSVGSFLAKNSIKDEQMSNQMTKTQLVAAVAEAMGSDKKTAGAALDAIASVVSREVAAGGAVTIPGLGKVACKARPERMVRNPATGEQMKKPADKQVKFAIAKALKDVVNG